MPLRRPGELRLNAGEAAPFVLQYQSLPVDFDIAIQQLSAYLTLLHSPSVRIFRFRTANFAGFALLFSFHALRQLEYRNIN